MTAHPKPTSYRNPDLLEAVSFVPCVSCFVWNYTQAAHLGGLAQGKGRSVKVPDSHIAGLCTVHPRSSKLIVGCHELLDQHKLDPTREYEFIAKTYIALVERGLLVVDKKLLKQLRFERNGS